VDIRLRLLPADVSPSGELDAIDERGCGMMLNSDEFMVGVEAVVLLGCVVGLRGLFLEDRSFAASPPLRGRRLGGIVAEFCCS
jgi:hypothetical protein